MGKDTDKKSSFIGILCFLAAFGLWFGFLQPTPEEVTSSDPSVAAVPNTGNVQEAKSFSPDASFAKSSAQLGVATLRDKNLKEDLVTLENDYIKAVFTNAGAGIKQILFKKYPESLDSEKPYAYGDGGSLGLGLAFSQTPSNIGYVDNQFSLIEQTDNRLVFETKLSKDLHVKRVFEIVPSSTKEGDPYLIKHSTVISNMSSSDIFVPAIYLGAGTAPPEKADKMSYYLNFGYYNGNKAEFIDVNRFGGSKGFFGLGAKPPVAEIYESLNNIEWISVKNQFFASVLTPEQPGSGIFTTPVQLDVDGDGDMEQGITGALLAKSNLTLQPSESYSLNADFYMGPKEFVRLEQLGESQDKVMQFGPLGFISKLLLIGMLSIHSFVPNWGLTIILLTCVIKLMLWPLTAKATRSSKRMAKIQEPLKALREKYKNSPQKMQQETMRLFKENKVNPAAGCLPVLIQIPIFLALFWMIRSASELRFAEFLWIKDLSAPDTITHFKGVPINILPLIMGVTMFFQMKMTPTPSADAAQQKIFKFLPFIFLFVCYGFSSGLVLYWTVQNLISIFQQWLTNRRKDDDGPVVVHHPKVGNRSKGKKHKGKRALSYGRS